MTIPVHHVTNRDTELLVGDCSVCGPGVPLRRHRTANGDAWSCARARREASRRSYVSRRRRLSR